MILERAGRLLSRWRRGAASDPPLDEPPRTWADELREGGLTASQWLAARQAAGRLFVDLPDQHVHRLRERYPNLVAATVVAADRALRHEFDLLGSGPYTPADPDRPADADGYRPIDWYLDPVTGRRFPRGVPLPAWNFEQMRPEGADIKLPWELARCQHWPLLGQAYRLTREDRFAWEIVRELRDFMNANPIGTAVNWACTMDVALRAANWAVALELIRPCALPPEVWMEAYQALFDHGAFIERHLENHYEVTSNHFLSDVVGLFYVASIFRDLPRGALWNSQCRTWLVQEMDAQVLPDGADYESSVPYHRLVSELFLGAARVAETAGTPLPERFLARLSAMIEFLSAVQRPDGLMPQVGDADDGRLHVLSEYETWKPQDPRHLFGPAAGLFARDDWARGAGAWSEWEAEWWGFDAPRPAVHPPAPPRALRHFPHAGMTVMRRNDDYLLITNGIVGTGGFGNHKHNDLLSFEYHAAGAAVIVDPGSYVYTSDPDARNLFRSTRSHNTLRVDDQEQNELRPEWLFRMFEKASPEHVSVRQGSDELEYRGRQSGYGGPGTPLVHNRRFRLRLVDGALIIDDKVDGQGRYTLRWHFHFAPGVTIGMAGTDVVEIAASDTRLKMTLPYGMTAAIAAGWYSPSYGVRVPCMVLDLQTADLVDQDRQYTFELSRR